MVFDNFIQQHHPWSKRSICYKCSNCHLYSVTALLQKTIYPSLTIFSLSLNNPVSCCKSLMITMALSRVFLCFSSHPVQSITQSQTTIKLLCGSQSELCNTPLVIKIYMFGFHMGKVFSSLWTPSVTCTSREPSSSWNFLKRKNMSCNSIFRFKKCKTSFLKMLIHELTA